MSNEAFYRGVAAILVNPEGKILLQQRDDRPDLLYGGYWTTFGGGIEPGETPDEAVRRELLEEIELDLPMRFWKVMPFVVKFGVVEVSGENYVYVGQIGRAAEDITLNEGQALGYFGLDDLSELKIAFDFEPLFREVLAALEAGTLPLGAEA